MKTKKKKKLGAPSVWTDDFYVKAYRLSKAGLSEEGIAGGLGVRVETFRHWKKTKPALMEAVKEGRKPDEEGSTTYQEYVYNRLSPDLQHLWQEIESCSMSEEPNAIARLENMLSDTGKRARQQLFLQSLVHFNFDLSQALRAVNISRDRFDRWVTQDPNFAKLIDEMDWHRKNFFEGKLVELVRAGDPGIVKFVNSTYNADRGYGKTTTVNKNVNVSGTVYNTNVPIEELGLSFDERKALLKKMRSKKE